MEFCEAPVEELTEIDVRAFLVGLMRDDNICTNSINTYNSGLRFFFAVTLNRTMNYLQMPKFKKEQTLPVILSRTEIAGLFQGCVNLKHKAIFMLAYGSGLRVSEICKLRVCDIDSIVMRVFIKNGKGGKDRYSILSHECLCVLREYWRSYRPKHPEGWLFLGCRNKEHRWLSSREKFFIPIRVLSKKFRGMFLHYLRELKLGFCLHRRAERLILPKPLSARADNSALKEILFKCITKKM